MESSRNGTGTQPTQKTDQITNTPHANFVFGVGCVFFSHSFTHIFTYGHADYANHVHNALYLYDMLV